MLVKPRDYAFAQVCAGGIDTKDIHTDTLMSRLVPGLFFCGELLDVDGICGGYNLQWGWSSGYVAGRYAAEYVSKQI
jgi:predicted flavoprotein YhiN